MGGGRRVLVTRPGNGAEKTAARLVSRGHTPVILPLTRTVSLDWCPAGDAVFDAVVITSANAARHAGAGALAPFAGVPCLAVGDSTADAARAAGLADVTSAAGDVRDLVRLVSERFSAGARLAYLCGRVRRPDLEAQLSARGFETVALEAYDTVEVSYSTHDLIQRLGPRPIDDVMVFSAAGAKAAGQLANRAEVSHLFDNTQFLCISERVAAALQAPFSSRARVAAHPDESALLALL